MIVTMKKVMIFIKQHEVDTALSALRKAGLVHIMTPKKGSEQTRRVSSLIQDFQRAVSLISQAQTDSPGQQDEPQSTDRAELETEVREVLEANENIPDYREQLRELSSLRRVYHQWGDVNPHDVSSLAEKGIYVTLAKVDSRRLPDDIPYILLDRGKNDSKVLYVTREPDQQLPGDLVSLPEMSMQEIQQEQDRLHAAVHELQEYIQSKSRLIAPLKDEIRRLSSELEYEGVKNGLEQEEPVCWFMGFVPEEHADDIRSTAKDHAWGILIDDPVPEEPVPTKLKNKPFVRIIEPVFRILGTVPGYREYDISALFLGFFAVFVAMIFGDAGYGALFLTAAVVLHIRSRQATKVIGLLYLLSITTIIWGALTGSWFGSETIASYGIFQAMTIPAVAAFPEVFSVEAAVTQQNIMYLCFIIGTVQLGIACLMNLKRDFPRLASFSHAGWFLMIIGLYLLVLNLVLGFDTPQWTYYLIGAGFALIIIFSAQREGRNFFKGLALGIGGLFTTFLDSVSTFSNIISYIRLFAVGMATVAISSNFNSMAAPLFGGVMIPAALIILLIGHGMNIVMALLSVFVHGIRLNMLEFSGQLGMEWTGFSYSPFREHKETQDT